MFKCEKCKKNTVKGKTQFKRRKYRVLRNKEWKITGKAIVSEEKVCIHCFKKYGETIK